MAKHEEKKEEVKDQEEAPKGAKKLVMKFKVVHNGKEYAAGSVCPDEMKDEFKKQDFVKEA